MQLWIKIKIKLISKWKITPFPLYNSDNPLLSDYKDSLDIFGNKPFWIWDQQEHNEQFTKPIDQCCYNHIIGKPVKNNVEHPLYDYELQVTKTIEENNNVFVKVSRGLGITELILSFLTWKILYNSGLDFKKIFIISGTREQHANNEKQWIQDLFSKRFPLIILESKSTH